MKKRAEHNPLTSGNENTALEAFALDTSAPSSRANALHELLAAVVPGVTERETGLVIQMLNARPAVQSGSAVLPREIRDGNGPALVAEVRRQQAGQPPASVPTGAPTPVPPQYADQCGWCCRPGHDADTCPEREPAPAPEPPAAPAAPGEPCAAGEQCLRPSASPIDPDTGYHARCAAVAAARASLAVRPAALDTGGDLAAEAAHLPGPRAVLARRRAQARDNPAARRRRRHPRGVHGRAQTVRARQGLGRNTMMTERPATILTRFVNAAFNLDVATSAEARRWLGTGGWPRRTAAPPASPRPRTPAGAFSRDKTKKAETE